MYRKVLKTLLLSAMLLLPLSAAAVGTRAMKERVEVAMRLTGAIKGKGISAMVAGRPAFRGHDSMHHGSPMPNGKGLPIRLLLAAST